MANKALKDFISGTDVQDLDYVYAYRPGVDADRKVTNVLSKAVADATYVAKTDTTYLQETQEQGVNGFFIPGSPALDISNMVPPIPEGFCTIANDNGVSNDFNLYVSHNNAMKAYWSSSTVQTYAAANFQQKGVLPAMTGDVTSSGSTNATTIANNAVTYAKLQQVSPSSLIGNPTASPANAQSISVGTGLALSVGGVLSATGSSAPVQSVFGRTGTVTAQSGDYNFSQIGSTPTTLTGYGIALSGDVSNSGNAVTIAANAVTYAKLQQLPATSLVANPTGSAANSQAVTLGAGLSFSGTTLTATGSTAPVQSVFGRTGTVTAQSGDYSFSQIGSTPTTLTGYGVSLSGDVSNSGNAVTVVANAITYSKFQQMPAQTLHGNPTGSAANSSAITLGAGLSFSGTTLNTTNSGTVTSVSVASANGFSGTVATPSTTPALTLQTTISGVLKGQTNALVAATDSDITAFKITGFVSGAGALLATDSILQSVEKLDGNVGLRALDSAVVHNTGNETIAGTKTFSSAIAGSITGNAATVTTVPALTGDVTTTGSTNATTIANNAVTYAKMQQIAAHTLIGNTTGASATPAAVATSLFVQSVNVQKFTASGTYTPTAGMKFAIVEMQGAGGGGGGAAATSGSQSGAGGGGGSGAFVIDFLTASDIGASKVITIAAGGSVTLGSNGSNAGTTSLGTLTTAGGGFGGTAGPNSAVSFQRAPGGNGSTTATATSSSAIILNGRNGRDGIGYGGNAVGIGGDGGFSNYTGILPQGSWNAGGVSGSGYGAGGGGAGNGGAAGAGLASIGLPGLVIITEYIAV